MPSSTTIPQAMPTKQACSFTPSSSSAFWAGLLQGCYAEEGRAWKIPRPNHRPPPQLCLPPLVPALSCLERKKGNVPSPLQSNVPLLGPFSFCPQRAASELDGAGQPCSALLVLLDMLSVPVMQARATCCTSEESEASSGPSELLLSQFS